MKEKNAIRFNKERETRIQLKNDFPFFAHNSLKITVKDSLSVVGIKDLRLNRAQLYLHAIAEKQLKEKGFVRIIVDKGRQLGISTYIGARYFWKVIHKKGIKSFILTHRKDATENLFEMTQRFYKHLKPEIKPYVSRNNAKELSFTLLDSGYKVGTAASEDVGRSGTIHLFHGSEVAFWGEARGIVSGVMQSIPRESEIFLESTANGIGNYFHEQWLLAEKGETDFIPVFLPWYWQDEYQDPIDESFSLDAEETEIRDLYGLNNNQMAFRKRKIKEMTLNLFKQEYPFNATESFQASSVQGLISSHIVDMARKNTDAVKYGPLFIGVDPARNDGGGDRTAIICRQGRVAFDLRSFKTDDLMHIVGVIVGMINEYSPDAICIDVIGLGAGIVDRLKELGYQRIVKPINCGVNAYDKQKYRNIKAEMWFLMKEWLMNFPCQIPDIDTLQTDLCCINFKENSISQKIMEDKDSLKKRGFKSPDEAEALALTFAFPISHMAVSTVKPYSYGDNIFR